MKEFRFWDRDSAVKAENFKTYGELQNTIKLDVKVLVVYLITITSYSTNDIES